jgi:hypothetical protein
LRLLISFQPLNSAPDSSWAVYFKENEVLLQIDKDVRLVLTKKEFFFIDFLAFK